MKIGILGGGQLGKMLCAPAAKLDMNIHFMDKMTDGPVARISKTYSLGDITDFNDVTSFGRNVDILSIEIEKVNTKALRLLQEEGIRVFPQPDIVECIQDKGLQKEFYIERGLPTSRFEIYEGLSELRRDIGAGLWRFPFVQKLRKDGYDGRGVHMVHSEMDLKAAFTAPFIVEEKISVDIELGIVTCRNEKGEIALYDPSEMVFHPDANILLYQLAPARISKDLINEAKRIAREVTNAFGIVGLLAIELFVTTDGEILINEVAPRPHNSGHHTIEATLCSQYENHLRAICNYPLGATNTLVPSLLMNILGDEGHSGPVHYEGLEKILALPGVHVHLYGKSDTQPFRKMGHITILGHKYQHLIEQYEFIKRNLQVITK